MPRHPVRSALAVAPFLLLLSVLTACTSAGGAAGPAGHRTVVETRLPGGAMFVEVVVGRDRTHARSWSDAAGGSDRVSTPLLEEIRIGTDHWVQLPALVEEGILEPGWIHLDLADPDERAWLEVNPLGLVEQQDLWSAGPGDPYGDDEIVSVDARPSGERELRLASGLELHVTREVLRTAPEIAPPDSLPVVPFRDVRRLLPAR